MKGSIMENKLGYVFSFAVFIMFLIWVLWADKALTVREFEISDIKIPTSFNGFRIAHISDLHNTSFGKDNIKLLEKLRDASPDIIAVTGDIIDSRRTDIAVAEEFITEALKIAPVYYVTGNHESRVTSFDGLLSFMENAGVVVAENKSIRLYRGNASITVCGISDPNFTAGDFQGYEEAVVDTSLGKLTRNEDFTVLLSHHPEFFKLYVQHGFELVLSGHAHGGQFRLPFVGGFIAPGQGPFPEYDSGLYREKGTSMIVSRGLGNSIIPLRFNNRPEIILITLKEEA
ncbi:MAG: metallophosphoesterase [Ruminococcaceae bacterium]|nr:metallophosphoesterase [Oscillospiraceae bacterium]